MPAKPAPRTRREILNELRRLGKKMVGLYDEELHRRADMVLWEAYKAGFFRKNRHVELAAKEQEQWILDELLPPDVQRPRHLAWGFTTVVMYRWYSFEAGKDFAELTAFNVDPGEWPSGFGEMLQAIPKLIGVSEQVRERAKQLIDEKIGPPYPDWATLSCKWGGNYDRFRRSIVPQLKLLGYEKCNHGIKRTNQ